MSKKQILAWEGTMKLRPGTPEEAGMSAQRVRHVAKLAESWVAEGVTPALVVLAARRGVVVLHEAFGRLTPDPDSPAVQRDTIYPLASLTKPITATAVMILVEEGLVSLNRPVAEYIPEFAGEGKDAVMGHHLLTHTSGLRDEDVNAHAEKKKDYAEIPPCDETQHPAIHERLFLGYDAPLWKRPGEEMSYCGFGYVLLGEILRRVSGRTLADFARERIFEPLGMNDTFYIVPDPVKRRVVRRPADAPYPLYDTREFQDLPAPAAGVYSTAIDLAIFGQMFLNQGAYGGVRILSPVTVAEMTRNQIPGISAQFFVEFFPEASWGLGWSIDGGKKSYDGGSLYSARTFSHGGVGGVFMWVDPVYEIVGIYLSAVVSESPTGKMRWNPDLFQNAVMAAILDVNG